VARADVVKGKGQARDLGVIRITQGLQGGMTRSAQQMSAGMTAVAEVTMAFLASTGGHPRCLLVDMVQVATLLHGCNGCGPTLQAKLRAHTCSGLTHT
jgi:hypothetical protein